MFPFFGLYCASKFAAEALAEAYRYELSGFGVESIIIEPGPFGSNLLPRSPAPGDRALAEAYGDVGKIPEAMKANFQQMYDGPHAPRTEDVADVIVRLIEHEGRRPLRTVVMPKDMDFGVERLNAAAGAIQNDLMSALQFAAMI